MRNLLLALSLAFAGSVSVSAVADAPKPNLPPVLLQMIRDDAIHQELRLTDPQIALVRKVLVEVDGPWFRARITPAEQQQAAIDALTDQLAAELKTILTPAQRSRLNQLQRQALGARMVLDQDVQRQLKVTAMQMAKLSDLFAKSDNRSRELQQSLSEGERTAKEVQEELSDLKESEVKTVVESLTVEQRNALAPLTGEPFDFTSLKRSYPLAPELNADGVTWVQGGPLRLSDLRGKVVALHFYAFQCINCRRNLPHYAAWHRDYADRGLVVVGIQTPETSAERSLDQVRSAAKSEGIEYPVMLDADSSNWKTWGNTMWPTVYLIDKKGFIRRWWQGEMNWQGTEGEKQMRATIEELLRS
ncbi:redoxin domain-containing protein [Novipirellula artificiosorum]|uniref:Thiol-disulfide oxidoreductase ResA n=1 Tax=Novipirellula artificiosorum TaxID=2528016 RepID=A0A5C6DD59_9BACT|nr:redoxin domain-containing protein [Novipirellula artificiosorum]TWU35173.1 Thiol-disulfide oxidoreductase ResA [Novipirellula artificiosorum]